MRCKLFLALLMAVVAGCSNEDDGSANGPCGANGKCPTGFTCEPRLNLCLATKTTDAGTTDARLTDAGSGDAPSGPITSITPGFDAGAPTNAASVSFAFQAQIPATFECKVDSAAFSACTSPLSLSPAEGTHMLTVRATAGAIVEANPPTATFTIDRTAPVFTLGTVDTDPNAGTMTVSYSVAPAGDAAGLDFTECALDGVACACGAISAACGEVAAGEHIFSVAAKDAAQNQGPTATSNAPMTMTYGPNAGRVVLIGHDFAEANPSTSAILGGALGEVPFVLEKLGFSRTVRLATFRSASADDTEVKNALDALNGLYDTKSVATITTPTAAALESGLRSRDVLLVFDQNDQATSVAARDAWNDDLRAFVAAGGVVVVLDGLSGGKPSNTYLVVSNLLDVTQADAIETAFVDDVKKVMTATEVVNGDTSPLAPAGAATQYSAPADTVVYTAGTTNQRWIYQRVGEVCPDNCSAIFNPTVIEKVFPEYTIVPTFDQQGFDGFSASPHVEITVATTPPGVPAKRFDCSYTVESCQLATCQGSCPTDATGNFLTPDAPADYDLEIHLIDAHGVPGVSYATPFRISAPFINDYNPQLTNITCIEDETLPARHLVFSLVETLNGVPIPLGMTRPPAAACSEGPVVFSFSYACITIGNPIFTVSATDDGGNVATIKFCDR